MEWIILFIISYILFVLLVDWRNLKTNIWCGFMATALQLAVDSQAMTHGYYKIMNPIIQVRGSSLFFMFGPVFVIGVLIAQYHPLKRWVRIINIFAIAGFFFSDELFLLSRTALIYINWHYIDSLAVNIIAIASLSWFSIVVLEKGRRNVK